MSLMMKKTDVKTESFRHPVKAKNLNSFILVLIRLHIDIFYLQIEYGDSKVTEAGSQHCSQALERFYPKKYTDPSEEGQRFVHITQPYSF